MFVIISYHVDYMIVVSENNFVFVFFIIYPLFFCTKENVYSYDDLQFSICHSECHNFQIDKVSSIEHILMTVNYSYNTCQNQLSFLYWKRKKNSHANKIDPKALFNKRNFNMNNNNNNSRSLNRST